MCDGWGRIINVTTSLGTMLNAGSPTYDGTGVTVNVLVPGGITSTPMVSDETGFNRARLIQPEVIRRLSSGSSPMPPGR
jgi:hypothetical protein